MSQELRAPVGVAAQPMSKVEWVDRALLTPNEYNPNKQAPPEHRLLKLSILENGWTQPIVVRVIEGKLSIVDGEHRWRVSGDPEVSALTAGKVPIVQLPECDPTVARLATVRHNRARGTHYVLAMAEIVADLVESGMSPADIGRRLEMDAEEVSRLADRGNMLRRGSKSAFNQGWTADDESR